MKCPQLSHLQFAICAELWKKPGKTREELIQVLTGVLVQERLEKMLVMLVGYELIEATAENRLVLTPKALPLIREFQTFVQHYNQVMIQ